MGRRFRNAMVNFKSEEDLENYLKNRFPSDKIIPVPKGMKGADCIQEVRQNEKIYGRILWAMINISG